MPNGTPSHDTFNRFFSVLDPNEFENAFQRWMKEAYAQVVRDVISIDGKTKRGINGIDIVATHIVRAWSNESEIALGQLKTDSK